MVMHDYSWSLASRDCDETHMHILMHYSGLFSGKRTLWQAYESVCSSAEKNDAAATSWEEFRGAVQHAWGVFSPSGLILMSAEEAPNYRDVPALGSVKLRS